MSERSEMTHSSLPRQRDTSGTVGQVLFLKKDKALGIKGRYLVVCPNINQGRQQQEQGYVT